MHYKHTNNYAHYEQLETWYEGPGTPHPDGPRTLPVWRCEACGHLVSADLIDPVAPNRCRRKCIGLDVCHGWYAPDALLDSSQAEWTAEEREEVERKLMKHFAASPSERTA